MKKIVVILIVLMVLLFSVLTWAENGAKYEKTDIKNATPDSLGGWHNGKDGRMGSAQRTACTLPTSTGNG